MPQYIAFLRGMNVGGHRIKMGELRAMFESLGLQNVATFIASGNVMFETGRTDEAALEAEIAQHLHQSLGYQAAPFLRTAAELRAIAAYMPFPEPAPPGHTLAVLFMAAPLPAKLLPALAASETPIDRFHSHGRELYWLTHSTMSASQVDWPLFAKRVPVLSTTRNITTVRKIAAKYAP